MEIHSDYYTNDILDKGKESVKIDKKFNDYKLKFNSNYLEIKNSLNEIQDNIINYNSELKKLEKFLNEINEHDKNFREIIKRLNKLAEYLQETINIEKIINQLSNNQQVINIQEYISIYNRVKAIYKFFEESKFHEKEDYLNKLNNMMYKGFKEFEELFYVLLKKYEQMKSAQNTEKNNDEKSKLLDKIRKLSVCLQDEKIGFNFTSKFVIERKQKIKDKLEEITLFSKTLNKQKYEKGSYELIKLFIESISIYENEEKYIKFIFSECDKTLHEKILKEIMKQPLGKIITLFTKLISNHKRFDDSVAHSMPVEYFKNLDIIDLWVQQISPFYNNKIKNSNPEEFKSITEFISQIKKFCLIYIKNFFNKIEKLNDEKIENENLLNITTDTIDFLTALVLYNNAYSLIQQELKKNKENNDVDLSPRNFILILVKQLEEKSKILLKKYRPLKNILLINNFFYIHNKICQQPLSEFFEKNDLNEIKEKINMNSKEYLKNTWKKIAETTFSDKNDIIYDKETNELKATSKELIKKRFITFNEEMEINSKVQQHIQIIDKNIEQVEQELKTYFSVNINYQI